MEKSRFGSDDIIERLKQLNDVWVELQEMAVTRGQKLDESITYQQFLAKIEEEEAWISEKQQLLTVPDLGENMAAVQGLLKKHDAFETDLSVHSER